MHTQCGLDRAPAQKFDRLSGRPEISEVRVGERRIEVPRFKLRLGQQIARRQQLAAYDTGMLQPEKYVVDGLGPGIGREEADRAFDALGECALQ